MLLYLIIGIVVGAVIGYLVATLLQKKNVDNNEINSNLQELSQSQATIKTNETIIEELKKQLSEVKSQKEQAFNQSKNFEIQLTKSKTDFDHLQQKLEEQKKQVKELQDNFKVEFKALATDILKEQSKDFKEQNSDMLLPFREQLKSFQDTIRKQNDESLKRASSFKEQMEQLKSMNTQISEDAQNLAKALKGDTKQQGNWGELILEKVLESSDLVKGQEYETQVNDQNDDGKRIQPDVVVYLPEEKHIIIDSKVSLTAYEKFVNAETTEIQEKALKDHLISIKSHIKNLAEKKYQNAERLSTPDFILMFIPIESSFGIAVKEDVGIFNYAWDRKIVMVSPSTLLATLKTIASIWKQEKQNKNVLLIAEESGKLYDKFVGFLSDLDSIETNFKRVSNQLDDAKKKLSTGRGNIIDKVAKLKKLGAKANKEIDTKYFDEQ